jgi:predicted MFS family arabinose efflux permease
MSLRKPGDEFTTIDCKPYVRLVRVAGVNRTSRILMFATLVNTFGNGAYLTTSALLLTRSVGLTTGEVAAGLSVGAFAGMVLSTPMGYIVDRLGPKRVQVVALLALAAGFAALTRAGGVWPFAAITCVIGVGDATVKSANGALIAAAVPPGERVRARAYVRSTNNAGIALGALVGGIPLAQQTGRQIGNLAAPPLLTALVIGLGAPGWLALTAVFAAVAWAIPAIVRRAVRRTSPLDQPMRSRSQAINAG